MLKIADRFKLNAEELKTELIAQASDYRMEFDMALNDKNITEDERLKRLNFIANCSAAIYTFLATKAGIDVRNDDGGMAGTSATGYFGAKIMDVEQRIQRRC